MASPGPFCSPLTALEVASGIVLGAVSKPPIAAPDRGGRPDVRAALEAAMRPALQRPPCFVAFSGGRDSSAMLAVADRLAAREGLARPVALSARFPGITATDESAWQERAIAALRIDTWERLALRPDDVEGVAPAVQEALRRHGLLFPANVGLFLALLDRARGGSLITGLGGDELLGAWRYRGAADLLAGRRTLGSVGARAAVRPLVPRAVLQQRAMRAPSRHGVPPATWLAPAAARAHARSFAAELAEEPHAWRTRVRWKARRRRLALLRESVALMGADVDVLVVHPLLDPSAVEALARSGGLRGFGTRAATLQALFGDLLPPDLLARETKAHFDDVFWGPATRAFARRVLAEGELPVPALLDRRGLAAAWTARRPPAVSLLLLHASWLASSGLLRHELLTAAQGR
jgi:asparagine synthetase B (glutamine-hydrolysing)